MIAAWMLSAVLVGALVTAGAMAADRVFSALRRQTRFVWIAAMGITLAWPLLAYGRARMAEGPAVSAPLRSSVQQMTAIVVRVSERSLHMRADVLLLIVWSLLSAILLARMFMTLRALRADGRAWRSQRVDGVQIRLSRDVGPAVVGLDPMEVVLPEWALDLEPPLRALVLAHEEEHRRARDPYLLLLSAALIVLVPWNPALWLHARRLRLAIELDCDARVLRSHPRPERYSLLLLAIAQRRTAGMSLLVPALSESTSNLERRINTMNNPLKNESRVRIAVLGGIAVALVVVACAIDAPVAPKSAITNSGSDGKGVATAWMRDSAGQRVKIEALYDPKHTAREREALKQGAREQVAPTRVPDTTVFYEFRVEKVAEWITGTGAPKYPEALKAAGVEGEVSATFVVDAEGHVDPNSIKVTRSTNASFADAVVASVPNMRFTPALVGGRAVMQLVRQSFVFSVK